MEEQRSTSKQDNKKAKSQLPVTGGGVQSLIFWGGSLAVAGLVAYFTIKKVGKRDDSNRSHSKEQHERSQGLLSVLQPPLHHNQWLALKLCCAKCALSKLGIRKNCDEEEPLHVIYGSEEDGVLAGFSSRKPENMITDGCREDCLMDIIRTEGENEAEDAEQMDVQDISLKEEEREDDDDDDDDDDDEDDDDDDEGDDDEEEEEEQVKESGVEVMRPAETIDVLSPETINPEDAVNGIQSKEERGKTEDRSQWANNYRGDCFDEDRENNHEDTMAFKHEKQELQAIKKQRPYSMKWELPTWPLKWKTPIWTLLVLVIMPVLMLILLGTCYFE